MFGTDLVEEREPCHTQSATIIVHDSKAFRANLNKQQTTELIKTSKGKHSNTITLHCISQ